MQSKRPKVEREKNIDQLSGELSAIDCLSDLAGAKRCVDEAERAMLPLKKAIELSRKKVIVAQASVLIESALGLKTVSIQVFYTMGPRGYGYEVGATCVFEVIGKGVAKSNELKERKRALERRLEDVIRKAGNETLKNAFGGIPTSGPVFVTKLCKALLGPKGAAKWDSEVEAYQIGESVPIPQVKRRSMSL